MEHKMQETIVRRIDFCDVDMTGVMWHGNYCKYYEEARCQLLEKLGFSYQEIYKRHYQIPLVFDMDEEQDSDSIKVLSLFSGCGGMDLGFEGSFFANKRSFAESDPNIVFKIKICK